jgi:salicylate hydroxylase
VYVVFSPNQNCPFTVILTLSKRSPLFGAQDTAGTIQGMDLGRSENGSSKKPFTIAIIGGGLGGLALTIGLLEQGITPQIYEAASCFSEIGAGVIFGPNAVRAVSLISPSALKAFKKCVTNNQSPDKLDTWLTFRYGTDSKNTDKKCGDLIWELKGEDKVLEQARELGMGVMSSVHRAKFLDELIELVPEGTATFKKALIELEDLGEEGVKMYFADGTTAKADAVIGCDGIKSKVRASLMKSSGRPTVEPAYTGEYAYRSLIDAAVAKEILGEETAMNGGLWQGYNGYVVHYPVENGRLVNAVAVRRDQNEKWNYGEQVAPGSRQEMYNDFKEWDPLLQRLLREFKSSDKWSLWDIIHDEQYFKGQVCLLGDSAHASTPHLGAGAGFAMEDAHILSTLIGSARESGDLEEIFKAYDTVRRSRTQNLVIKSRQAGKAYEFVGQGIDDEFEALRRDAQFKYRWIWEIDLEKQLKQAKLMLQ